MTNATWKGEPSLHRPQFAETPFLPTARFVTSQIWQFPQICNLKWKGGNPKQKGQPLLFNIQYRQMQRLKWCTWASTDFRAEIFGGEKRKMKTMNASQRPPLLSSYSRCDLKENIITFFLSTCEKYYILWASLKLCHLRWEHPSSINYFKHVILKWLILHLEVVKLVCTSSYYIFKESRCNDLENIQDGTKNSIKRQAATVGGATTMK